MTNTINYDQIELNTNLSVHTQPETDLSNFTTTSSKIRYLHDQGMKRSQIAKTLNIRYQHVRNVLITPVKKS